MPRHGLRRLSSTIFSVTGAGSRPRRSDDDRHQVEYGDASLGTMDRCPQSAPTSTRPSCRALLIGQGHFDQHWLVVCTLGFLHHPGHRGTDAFEKKVVKARIRVAASASDGDAVRQWHPVEGPRESLLSKPTQCALTRNDRLLETGVRISGHNNRRGAGCLDLAFDGVKELFGDIFPFGGAEKRVGSEVALEMLST